MDIQGKTSDMLLDQWEARRKVKNQMGILSYLIVIRQDQQIFEELWSHRSDICLGTNQGWYNGYESVATYYQSLSELCRLTGDLMKEAYPTVLGEKNSDELFGTGVMDYKPLESEIVEVAEDLMTAKGLWTVRGTHSLLTSAGPVGYWEWGWMAVDFVYEDNEWKIWHLLYVDDVDFECGTDWVSGPAERPDFPAFAPIKEYELPEPNIKSRLRELYHPGRPFTKPPRMPEPYRTFTETFSYGYSEER